MSFHMKSVPIDACVLADHDVAFLQQACSITDGVYDRPAHDVVEQCLLQSFLVRIGSWGAPPLAR